MKTTGYVLKERIRYIPRNGGNPHLVRDVWAKCPDCGKERWTDKNCYIRHDTKGLCQSCSAKRSMAKAHLVPIEDRPILKQSDGYLYKYLPKGHWCFPMAGRKARSAIILLHRLTMAEHIGRLLSQDEIVHHINGNREDNRIENLQIVTRGEHKMSYRHGYEQGYKDAMLGKVGVFYEN